MKNEVVFYSNYNLWRLMIDEAYQSQGYGKEAVSLALNLSEIEINLEREPDLCRIFGFSENLVRAKQEVFYV